MSSSVPKVPSSAHAPPIILMPCAGRAEDGLRATGSGPATRPSVLLVDDDETTLRSLETMLRAEGFATSMASDGEAGLAEARRALPDVVLTDLHMPRMGGVELCTRLKEIDDDLPVIIMTAQADIQSVIESLRERADDFLSKPLECESVIWRVGRAVARRLAKRDDEAVRRTLNERLVALAEAEARQRLQLSALLEKLSEGVVIADPSGRVVMINAAARVILGVGAGALSVTALESVEVFDPEGRRLGSESNPLALALRGESFTEYEVVSARPNGDRRNVLSTGTSVRDRDDAVALAIVVFHDVTDQRHVERQRAEFLSLISHDLRNPLNVVLMALGVLTQPTDTSEGPSSRAMRVHVAERAERNAQRMAAMLEEITESASLESADVAVRGVACDLRAVVESVIDSTDDVRAGRVTVETDAEIPYVVRADASRIERVVANLVTNALKYSSEDAPVSVRLTREGDQVVLAVTDRGIGIAPESVKRLFDRYYRAPPGRARASGLGLGLYIARLIVEAHGGRIDVSSEVGKGSVFRLTLASLPSSGLGAEPLDPRAVGAAVAAGRESTSTVRACL